MQGFRRLAFYIDLYLGILQDHDQCSRRNRDTYTSRLRVDTDQIERRFAGRHLRLNGKATPSSDRPARLIAASSCDIERNLRTQVFHFTLRLEQRNGDIAERRIAEVAGDMRKAAARKMRFTVF